MAEKEVPNWAGEPETGPGHFVLPDIADNAQGWGPSSRPAAFHEVPFSPFSKTDRLRISDWNQQGRYARRGYLQFGAGTGAFKLEGDAQDEGSFTHVISVPKQKLEFGRRPYKKRVPYNNNRRKFTNNFRGRNRRGRGGWGYNRRRYWNNQQDPKEPSIQTAEDWPVLKTWELPELQTSRAEVPAGKTLIERGTLEEYNSLFDRITPRTHKPLLRFESRQHFNVTTSDDPVIQELAAEKKGTVYATDTILALLMASTRSVNSWDVVVKKENGVIFFDKRQRSRIDFLTVNENWNEVQQAEKDSVNHPTKLSIEATLIGHNFSQQMVAKGTSKKLGLPNPFLGSLERNMEPASGGYRYRTWNLGEDIKVVSRCTVNGYVAKPKGKGHNYITIRALNEFDSKLSGNVDWRQKLESQYGAVLATEMKNNGCKLVRWTAETMLAGTDELRLGFVSRIHSKDSYKHVILQCKRFKPDSFAQSIKVKQTQLWGVLKSLIEDILQQEDGTYLLQKDPNATKLHLYQIPVDAFENENESEEEQ